MKNSEDLAIENPEGLAITVVRFSEDLAIKSLEDLDVAIDRFIEDLEGLVVKKPEDLVVAAAQTNPGLFLAIVQSWLFSKSDALERLRNNDELTLGQSIQKSRSVHGLTQERLAESVGVEPRTIQRWEAEESHPRPAHKHRLNIVKVINLDDETIDYMTWRVKPGESWATQLKHFSGEELPLNYEAYSFLMEWYNRDYSTTKSENERQNNDTKS